MRTGITLYFIFSSAVYQAAELVTRFICRLQVFLILDQEDFSDPAFQVLVVHPILFGFAGGFDYCIFKERLSLKLSSLLQRKPEQG